MQLLHGEEPKLPLPEDDIGEIDAMPKILMGAVNNRSQLEPVFGSDDEDMRVEEI